MKCFIFIPVVIFISKDSSNVFIKKVVVDELFRKSFPISTIAVLYYVS